MSSSLRQALRARFRSPEKGKDTASGEETALSSTSSATHWKALEEEDDISSQSQQVEDNNESREGSPHSSFNKSMDDQPIYEMQLMQLQEQLVAAMIENQSLTRELDTFKGEHAVSQLHQDLEYERERSRQLVLELEQARVQVQKAKNNRADTERVVEEAHEVTEDVDLSPQAKVSKSVVQRLNEWLLRKFYELAEDFSDLPESETEQEEDPLAVKKLKENLRRFKEGTTPTYHTVTGIHGIFAWKHPAYTLIFLLIYMYSVWLGYLLPVVLFILIQRLFINYLRHRGVDVNIRLFTAVEEESDKDAEALKGIAGVSDKFNLVLHVAKQVQNKLGHISDGLEKLKNLFLWKQPEATFQLFAVLCVAFVLSCLLPGTTLFTIVGLYMGFKMFVVEYIYTRYPRFKQNHDSVHKIWQTLPTDVELDRRKKQAKISRQILHSMDSSEEEHTLNAEAHTDRSKHDREFCEKYALPLAESPLRGWKGGKRCTLVNKDKPLLSSFRHGKLYLTRSFMVFELAKPSSTVKDLVIALSDITKVKKAKPYSWMPGAGMSIEVTVISCEKPYLFGAMLSRDESYDQITRHATKAGLPWAVHSDSVDSDTDHQVAAGEEEAPSLADQPFRMSNLKDEEDEDLLGLMNEF